MATESRSVLVGGGNVVLSAASGGGLQGELHVVAKDAPSLSNEVVTEATQIDLYGIKGHYFEAGSTKVFWNDGSRARRKTSETTALDNWTYQEKDNGIIEFRWGLNADEPIQIDYTIASQPAVVE
jgi:hypothetical protein